MGKSYNSYALIGYQIQSPKFEYETKIIKGCIHENPENSIFCSICGVKTKTSERSILKTEKYKQWYDDFVNDFANKNHNDYIVAWDSDFYLWAGYGVRIYDYCYYASIPIKDYEEIKKDIKELLKPFTDTGLLNIDEKTFRLYSITV